MKKFLCILLALLILMSLTVTVLADPADPSPEYIGDGDTPMGPGEDDFGEEDDEYQYSPFTGDDTFVLFAWAGLIVICSATCFVGAIRKKNED